MLYHNLKHPCPRCFETDKTTCTRLELHLDFNNLLNIYTEHHCNTCAADWSESTDVKLGHIHNHTFPDLPGATTEEDLKTWHTMTGLIDALPDDSDHDRPF